MLKYLFRELLLSIIDREEEKTSYILKQLITNHTNELIEMNDFEIINLLFKSINYPFLFNPEIKYAHFLITTEIQLKIDKELDYTK